MLEHLGIAVGMENVQVEEGRGEGRVRIGSWIAKWSDGRWEDVDEESRQFDVYGRFRRLARLEGM